MNWMDIVILANLGLCILWTVPFLLWQFDKIDGEEEFWQRIISFANIIETITLVLSRFVPFGIWGTIGLGAFYVITLIVLILQFVFSDFEKKVLAQTVLWILFYVFMLVLDVGHLNIFGSLVSGVGSKIQVMDSFLKDSWIGALIEAIIILVLKQFVQRKINS